MKPAYPSHKLFTPPRLWKGWLDAHSDSYINTHPPARKDDAHGHGVGASKAGLPHPLHRGRGEIRWIMCIRLLSII